MTEKVRKLVIRSQYRTFHICIDMKEGKQKDYEQLRRRLNALERDVDGVLLLGTDETDTWPSVHVC